MSMQQANENLSIFQEDLEHLVSANSYYVELPFAILDEQGDLLDALIHYSFDRLHVQHLDLRIVAGQG